MVLNALGTVRAEHDGPCKTPAGQRTAAALRAKLAKILGNRGRAW